LRYINEVNDSSDYDQNIIWKFYKSQAKDLSERDKEELTKRYNSLQTVIKKRSHSIQNLFQPQSR